MSVFCPQVGITGVVITEHSSHKRKTLDRTNKGIHLRLERGSSTSRDGLLMIIRSIRAWTTSAPGSGATSNLSTNNSSALPESPTPPPFCISVPTIAMESIARTKTITESRTINQRCRALQYARRAVRPIDCESALTSEVVASDLGRSLLCGIPMDLRLRTTRGCLDYPTRYEKSRKNFSRGSRKV